MMEMEKTLDEAKDEINRLEMSVQQERNGSAKLQSKVCVRLFTAHESLHLHVHVCVFVSDTTHRYTCTHSE